MLQKWGDVGMGSLPGGQGWPPWVGADTESGIKIPDWFRMMGTLEAIQSHPTSNTFLRIVSRWLQTHSGQPEMPGRLEWEGAELCPTQRWNGGAARWAADKDWEGLELEQHFLLVPHLVATGGNQPGFLVVGHHGERSNLGLSKIP